MQQTCYSKNALEKCSRPNFTTNWGGNKIRIQYDEAEKKIHIYLEKPHLFFENRERERGKVRGKRWFYKVGPLQSQVTLWRLVGFKRCIKRMPIDLGIFSSWGGSFARECLELLGSVDSFFGEFCFAFVAGVGFYRVALSLYKREDLGKSLLTPPIPPSSLLVLDTEYCLFWISYEKCHSKLNLIVFAVTKSWL